MKLKKYPDNESYVRSQRRTDRGKSSRISAHPDEIKAICEYIRQNRGKPSMGICHGVRTGQEVLWFRKQLPKTVVWGTELLPREEKHIVQWDFHDEKPEWVGAFDFVYSNALDHSHSPKDCLATWMRQLKPDGLAFILWTTYYRDVRGGDCFGAVLYEYILLMEEVGVVHDLMYLGKLDRRKSNARTVIVAGPK